MTGWTNIVEEGFDILRVMVLLEQCDPDYTMVIFRDLTPRVTFSRGAPFNAPPIPGEVSCWCLKCVTSVFHQRWEEPRTGVLNAVKYGHLMILNVRLRSELEGCPRCQPMLNKERSIVCVRQK